MIKIFLTMLMTLFIIGCGGGNGFSGGFPTQLNTNSTSDEQNSSSDNPLLNDNSTTLNDNATLNNESPILEDYVEVFVEYNKVRLFWKEATDSDGEIEKYWVSYRELEGEWSVENPNAFANYTLYLDYNQSYQVRIRAQDDQGGYSAYIYSEIFTIGVQTSAQVKKLHSVTSIDNHVTLFIMNEESRESFDSVEQSKVDLTFDSNEELKSIAWVDYQSGVLALPSESKKVAFTHNNLFIIQENDVAYIDRVITDMVQAKALESLSVIDLRQTPSPIYLYNRKNQMEFFSNIMQSLAIDKSNK